MKAQLNIFLHDDGRVTTVYDGKPHEISAMFQYMAMLSNENEIGLYLAASILLKNRKSGALADAIHEKIIELLPKEPTP